MTYLADADFVIDHFTNQPGARAIFPSLLQGGLALSIVTTIELYEGVYTSRDPKAAAAGLRTFLTGVTVLPLSLRVAQRTARLRGELRARKLPIQHRAYDLIVAATALVHDLTLVTSNLKDYQDIPGLKLLNSRATP